MFELGDAHRSRCVPESVFGNDSILRFAEDKTDAWLVVRMTKEVIDSGEVEIHLPGILGFKPAHFEIDDNEASELQVVEEQIDLEILSSNLERHLTSDEGKSHAEFDEKLAQVRKKPMFEVALLCLRRKGEEIEIVRIFDELLGEIRLCRWQSRLKVRERLPLPPVKATLNLHDENVPAPAVGGGLFRVPEPFLWTLHQVKEPDIVAPGQLCNRLLHNWPSLREGPHVFEIPRRKPPHLRELYVEILSKALNDLRAPAVFTLASENLLPNPPVEQNQLLINGQGRANLRRPNLALQEGKKILIALGVGDEVGHGLLRSPLLSPNFTSCAAAWRSSCCRRRCSWRWHARPGACALCRARNRDRSWGRARPR